MRLIRYNDLVARGVVKSRMTLKRLIDFQDFRRFDHPERAGMERRRS